MGGADDEFGALVQGTFRTSKGGVTAGLKLLRKIRNRVAGIYYDATQGTQLRGNLQ